MTDRYAVIGNPIAHSKSPQIHKMFKEETGQDISYEAILAPLDGFAAKVNELRVAGYKGCNVTVPFKFEACKLATRLTVHAEIAQAVNTLKFNFAGDTIFGDNTDGTGLVRDILFNLGITLSNKRVLLMGAGGAASGVVLPLLHQGANITIVNRTEDKAIALATRRPFINPNSQYDSAKKNYTGKLKVLGCSYDDIMGQQFDVVINATSTGLSDEMPPLQPDIFAPGALAYDMMYGRETPFMKFAHKHGAAVVTDGFGMLVEQAAESFFIWRGVRPRDTKSVIAKLRKQQ